MDLLFFGDTGYGDELAKGLVLTITLAVSSYGLSLVLGIIFGFVALAPNRFLRYFWRGYSSALMGVPSVLVIFFVYFNLPMILRKITGSYIEVSALTAGIISLTGVYATYIGEAVRGAVINIPSGQFEAGRSLGLKTLHLWWLILIPQAIKLALPGITNIWLILLKDTALVSLVGLTDIVRVANIASGVTKEPFIFYIAASIAFIAITLLSMIFIRRAENWAYRGYAEEISKRPERGNTT